MLLHFDVPNLLLFLLLANSNLESNRILENAFLSITQKTIYQYSPMTAIFFPSEKFDGEVTIAEFRNPFKFAIVFFS